MYWQVGSSATLGTGSTFAGNILALTSISPTTGARLNGRALARNGAVTLDNNTVAICQPAAAPSGVPAVGFIGLSLLVMLLAGAGLFVMNRFSI